MRLSDTDIIPLLPNWMRKEQTVRALSHADGIEARRVAAQLELLSRWNKIDELPEEYLDELAWELCILWYDSMASIDVKRGLIKSSDMVWRKMGTRWAVERVAKDYFGECEVAEWFEYGGRPYFFRLRTNASFSDSDDAKRFLAMLAIVKRESAWLDYLTFDHNSSTYLHRGSVSVISYIHRSTQGVIV